MVSKCPSQMSGPWSGLLGLDGFVDRGGGGGAPDLVPVGKMLWDRRVKWLSWMKTAQHNSLYLCMHQHCVESLPPLWSRLKHLTTELKLCPPIHCSQRMNPTNFGDLFSSSTTTSETSHQLLDDTIIRSKYFGSYSLFPINSQFPSENNPPYIAWMPLRSSSGSWKFSVSNHW